MLIKAPGEKVWSIDQQITSILIEKYTKQYSKRLEKKRQEGIRLDRSYSYFKWMIVTLFYFHALTDAHCYQGPATFSNINALRTLNDKLFNKQRTLLFNQYIDDYIRIRKAKNSTNFILVTLKNL